MMGPHIKDMATPLMACCPIKDIIILVGSHIIEVAVLYSVGLHIREIVPLILVGPHNDIGAIPIVLEAHIKDITMTPIFVGPHNKNIMKIGISVNLYIREMQLPIFVLLSRYDRTSLDPEDGYVRSPRAQSCSLNSNPARYRGTRNPSTSSNESAKSDRVLYKNFNDRVCDKTESNPWDVRSKDGWSGRARAGNGQSPFGESHQTNKDTTSNVNRADLNYSSRDSSLRGEHVRSGGGYTSEGLPSLTFRSITAELEILSTFTSASHLKETVKLSLETSDKVDVDFVRDSIICGENRGLCTLIIQTDSKQLAKRVVKNLCQNIRKKLGAKVSFVISSSEDDMAAKQEEMPRPSRPIDRRRQKAADILSNIGHYSGTFESNFVIENVEDVKSDFAQTPSAKSCIKEKTPTPIPTKIVVTIGRSFTDKNSVHEFMRKATDEKTDSFQVVEESIAMSATKTLLDLLAPSKAAAARIVKKLNAFQLDDVVVRSNIASDKTAKDTKTLHDQIFENVEKMCLQALENHQNKIENYEKAFNIIQANSNVRVGQQNDEDEDEILAFRNKLQEAIKQKCVFEDWRKVFQEKIKNSNISNEILKVFHQETVTECNRLAAGLPVYAKKKDIVDLVKKNQVSVILGETGSGKSTQIAQYLYEAGLAGSGAIICTQPRKVAAINLAECVAKELGEKPGHLVGYDNGIKRLVADYSKIIYSTDLCLLNEYIHDPVLSKYSCIIVDEANERSVYTDIVLGLIKESLANRQDLKLVILSALQDSDIFCQYFETSSVLEVSGKPFSVEVVYEGNEDSVEFEDHEMRAVSKAIHVHKTEGPGDVLVFLASPAEVLRCCEELERQLVGMNNFKCFPLHDQVSPDELKKVLQKLPESVRKIVLATNCAETVFPIGGIKYVIDTGLVKEMKYEHRKKIHSLATHIISRSCADQRKTIAGLAATGKCYRLYTEESYNTMKAVSDPGLLKENLAKPFLKLTEMKIDYVTFNFIKPPPMEAFESALSRLQDFGAFSYIGLKELGRWISLLPFEPSQGYLIYEGYKQNLLYESVVLAALINSGMDIFAGSQVPADTGAISPYGDLFSWFELYRLWITSPPKERLKVCKKHNISHKVLHIVKICIAEIATIVENSMNLKLDSNFSQDPSCIQKLRKIVFNAYVSNVCQSMDHVGGSFFSLSLNRQVNIDPASTLADSQVQPQWLVYTNYLKTHKDFIQGITIVEEDWVLEVIQKGKMKKANICKSQLVHREEVGASVFNCMVGPLYVKLQSLEDTLAQSGMANVMVEADRYLGTLDVYSSSPMSQETIRHLQILKADVLNTLHQEEAEVPFVKSSGNSQSGFRALFGLGGNVKTLLFPDQSDTVTIRKVRRGTTEEEIRNKFKAFGVIKECVSYKGSEPWGHVRYSTCLEADMAVHATRSDASNIAELKTNSAYRRIRSKFEARLSWRSILLGKWLTLPDRRVLIEESTRKQMTLNCFNTGDASERDIKKAIMALLDYDESKENNIHVRLLRQKVAALSKQELNQVKRLISEQFQRFMSESFNVSLVPVKDSSIHQVAIIHFNNPVAGFKACKQAQGQLFLGTQNIEICPSLKTTVNVAQPIMDVLKSEINEIITDLKKDKGVEIIQREKKQGDFALDILSSRPELLVEARDILQKELEGLTVECRGNDILKILVKAQGEKLLEEVEKSHSVVIIVDSRKERIHFYGTAENVTNAQNYIKEYLNKLGRNKKDISLRDSRYPLGILKVLANLYGSWPDGVVDQLELIDIDTNLKQKQITLLGESGAVDRALATISDLAVSYLYAQGPQEGPWMPYCIMCKCPVSDKSDLYRLECCGHCYCVMCLIISMNACVEGRDFPLTCAVESCKSPLAWRDLKAFFENEWLLSDILVTKSIDHFVLNHSDKYKFCLTPDCPVVYEVTSTEEGSEFNCPVCSLSVCTSCHTIYHVGLNCKMHASI
ncbi:uncharacterized protein LOC131942007 [Physella acuta]|uniref:uncharacterized protein LOC131942007 n=1 Tax=Physella acuta TaxID=109671 RepID=UPI0027DD3519|nr:uncharacterized protein LOC131942007 [Physella acuta]